MYKRIEGHFDLQNNLNNNTNGMEWTTGLTNKKRDINWLRCIRMELCELIDSGPWKHWKDINGKVDFPNIRVESTDIYHFLMSELIKRKSNGDDTDYISIMEEEFKKEPKNLLDFKYLTILSEKIMLLTLLEDNKMEEMTRLFVMLCINSGLTFEDLHSLYLGKNCLNEFRQLNGYKEGTYIKNWQVSEDSEPVEDNVIMKEVIDSLGNEASFNTIIPELTKIYKNKFN